VKSDEETSEKGSDKSSEKDGTSSSKKTALEELEKAKEDVGGGVRDEHKSKRKHSTDGKDKRKKDESGDKIETDKSESNDQLEKIHNEDLEKKTKEVDEVESNVSEVSSKSKDMKTDPNPSVVDPSAIDAESNVIDSVRYVKDSLSRNIGDETDAKLPGKAKIDPTQSNLQSKDETPVKESKGLSQSETVCDKTRDLIANTLPSHGTGKTDDKPYDTKEISTTEEGKVNTRLEGKHTDTLLDKTTEVFCIAESDGLESSSSVEVAEITPLDVSTSLDQNKPSNLDQIKSMSTLEGKFLDQGESNFEQIAKPLSNSEALSTKESSHPLQSDEPSEDPNKPFSTGEKSISTGEKSVSPPINTSEDNPPSNTAEDKVPLPSHPSPAKPIGSGGEIILRRKATSESEREKKRNDRVSSCSAGGSSSHSCLNAGAQQSKASDYSRCGAPIDPLLRANDSTSSSCQPTGGKRKRAW
ncbi:protein zds1-like, partial [Diaphorina citri]|uniref:Protein zds1-like n=1 Tax=Diaphorina citri TaxID=121845 RepID=A0A1S3DL45_DIACI